MATDLVRDTRKKFDERIKELEPLVDELQRLREARAALDGGGKKPRRRAEGSTGRGRRPQRKSEFLSLIEKRPGITVTEAAKELGMKPNYLYRVAKDLSNEREIAKKGSGYERVEATASAGDESSSNGS
jgi:hypothetical protein